MQWSQRFFGILYRFLDDFHRPSAQIRFVSAGQHLRSGTTSPDIWFCDAKKWVVDSDNFVDMGFNGKYIVMKTHDFLYY
jgi:hypothetical protein